MNCCERKTERFTHAMRSTLQNAKRLIVLLLAVATLLGATSCAAGDVPYTDETLEGLMPDPGLLNERPIDSEVLNGDLSIQVQRPTLKGENELEEETEAPEEEDDDMLDFEGSPWEEDEEEEDTSEPETTRPKETKPPVTSVPETEKPDTEDDPPVTLPPNIVGDPDAEYEFYDVPLPELKQIYVIETAKEFDIPVEWIFGVMYVESRYQEYAIHSSGKYIGIMQIAKSNLNMLNKKFGVTDLQDFQQNVTSGAYFLSYFNKKYDGDLDKILMCYHCGEGGAKKRWKNGILQDGYCTKVRKEIDRILSSTYDPES
jgi:hypothetical protein